jgi:hypothetical protein
MLFKEELTLNALKNKTYFRKSIVVYLVSSYGMLIISS